MHMHMPQAGTIHDMYEQYLLKTSHDYVGAIARIQTKRNTHVSSAVLLAYSYFVKERRKISNSHDQYTS